MKPPVNTIVISTPFGKIDWRREGSRLYADFRFKKETTNFKPGDYFSVNPGTIQEVAWLVITESRYANGEQSVTALYTDLTLFDIRDDIRRLRRQAGLK